jgi:hypothetical protein
MAGLTYKGSEVAVAVLNLISLNANDVGAEQTLYGDRTAIAKSPTVCVEPAQVRRSLAGSPKMMDNEIRVAIVVYSSSIEGVDVAQTNGDICAEKIEDLLNIHASPANLYADGNLLGGIITDGHVEEINSGYPVRAVPLMRVNRLVFLAYTHTHLVTDSSGAKHA